LSAVIQLISGQDFEPSSYNDQGIGVPYITGASNIVNEELIINRWTPTPRCISMKGQLLIVCKGAGVGKMVIMNQNEAHIARQIMSICPHGIYVEYIRIFLQYSLFTLREHMQGVIPGISRDDVLNLIIPIPPLQEQKRIATRIDNINSLLK